MRLADRIAVITGAGKEFGRAIALGYAREGADLYLHEFAEASAAAEALAADVRALGRRAEVGIFDLTGDAGAAAMTADALQRYARIDVLVNATNGRRTHGRFFEMAEGDLREALEHGVLSYFLTCRHVGKAMARRGSGKIINITSIVGVLGSGGAVVWGADRGAINALTAAVAQALGAYGINVTALARGATDGYPYSDEARSERLRRLPFGRLGREDDIVGPAIFLASGDSAWVTGSVLYCDGGYVTAAATDREHRAEHVPYTGP